MTTAWADGPMTAYDLETTGTDVETARIVTACAVTVNTPDPVELRQWVINPGIEVPAEATAVHGLTTEYLRQHGGDPAPALAAIRAALIDAWELGRPVVAFNVTYDLTVLDREVRRHGVADGIGQVGPVIDPLVIDRAVDRYRKGSRKLDAMCRHYGVRLDGAHDSAQDALAAARLAWRLAQWFPGVRAKTLDELMTAQQKAHEEWAAHYEGYLRRQGKPEVIDRSWPIRHVTAPTDKD